MESYRKIEQSGEEVNFEYFMSPDNRHDIYEFCKDLGQYLERQNLHRVIFIDRAARVAWVGLHEFWKLHYPEKPVPQINFINPLPFDPHDNMYDDHFEDESEEDKNSIILIDSGKAKSARRINRIKESVGERFEGVYSNLAKDKKSPLVLFDTCSHYGKTLKNVTARLTEIGFKDIRIITAKRPDKRSGIEVAHEIGLNAVHEVQCYPFGMDDAVEKGVDVKSDKNWDSDSELSQIIREDMRRVIREEDKERTL